MQKLINAASQLLEIKKQIELLCRLRYKLSNQLRSHKQFKMLRLVMKKTQLFIILVDKLCVYEAKDIDSFNLQNETQQYTRLKKEIQSLGMLLKGFFQRGYLMQFAVISYTSCAKIYCLIDKIWKKVEIVARIQRERNLKKQKKLENQKGGIKVQNK